MMLLKILKIVYLDILYTLLISFSNFTRIQIKHILLRLDIMEIIEKCHSVEISMNVQLNNFTHGMMDLKIKTGY